MSTQRKLPPLTRQAQRLLEWLESKTGFIKSNDFNRLPVCLRRAHLVKPALDELVSKGLADVVQTGYHSKPTAWALKGVQVEERIVERLSHSKGVTMNNVTPIRPDANTLFSAAHVFSPPAQTPAQIQTVTFHGQQLAVIPKQDKLLVAMKPICENIGIDWRSQRHRIMRDEVLSSVVVMMTTVAADGKTRELLCLPLEMLNGWLFGIDTNRIKNPEVKARVIEYKRECYQVLFDYWTKGHTSNPRKPQQPEQPQDNPQHRLRELIDASEAVMNALNLTGSSRLGAMQRFLSQQAPELVPLLPAYAVDEPSDSQTGSSHVSFSASHLLAKHGKTLSARSFNVRCEQHGLLEKKYRQGKRKQKWFWSVTEQGQAYGKNLLNPQGNETQPHWYESRFTKLLELLEVNE